jgi:hypothetical protein
VDYSLLNLESVLRAKGRGVVFYAVDGLGNPTAWDGTTELLLEHLGDTEGDITVTANSTVANLTLPEIAGDAVFEAVATGESPTLEFPLFLADPDLLSVVSPRNTASAGHIRVCDVAERTLVTFPEKFFADADCSYNDLSYTLAGGWKVGGVAATAAQLTYLEMSVWIWRGYFDKPDNRFLGGHGDDGKNIETVTFHAMMHPTMPDGHRLYTIGDPATAGILLEGTS